MNITGIVVEYNPFHNGHIRHINEAKKLTDADLLIAVTSGNFSQRGDVSVLNKFEKTDIALNYGVDLVVELPYIYTTQNARVFGEKSIEILKALNINNLVFGSETCNIDELKKYAELSIDVNHLREIMSKGVSYPEAYGLLAAELYPNDILAVSYLKAIGNDNINVFPIKRTSNYHDDTLMGICSATAIRKALKNHEDYSVGTPVKIDNPHFTEELYPYLRRLLFTTNKKDLENTFMVNEGIENLLIKNAYEYDSFDEFMNHSVTKRYTRSRIQRVMLQMMLQIKKEDVLSLTKMDYVRVLGFNAKGQQYLRNYQNDNYKIVTQFKNIPEAYKKIEWKASQLYASMLTNFKDYLTRELQGPVRTNNIQCWPKS